MNDQLTAPTAPTAPTAASAEQRLVAGLIQLMEAGTSPWRRDWQASGASRHANLFSGRPYGGANPALLAAGLALRGSSLPWWCGYAEARRHGLVPRRGTSGVVILRPQRRPAASLAAESSGVEGAAAETSAADTAAGSTAAGPLGVAGSRSGSGAPGGFRPVVVFNAADLVGASLEGLLAERQAEAAGRLRPEPERLARAEEVLERWPVPVLRGGERACYNPASDRIALPERGCFHTAAAAAATWAHEAIHSTGHPSRLGRDLSGAFGSPVYAREELVAELGAVLLGERLEIGSDTANHAAYLAHWVALLRQSPRLLFSLLREARRAADLICPA
jgi:antirestriction protein ArdC